MGKLPDQVSVELPSGWLSEVRCPLCELAFGEALAPAVVAHVQLCARQKSVNPVDGRVHCPLCSSTYRPTGERGPLANHELFDHLRV